ncbi:choice-of-anchor I family protein [Marinobacter sp. BGYM27]|uniref:choice-of-anchor I family protein n=1 Tax=Marinobacter sp. BGYM27 TaxID=2975597 RepID=UPI0021A2CAF8|nr:choice-of-anchor I family protein [Marinobacter sp. BGYM27]MDG5501083.1 choice-of-anchor I family protein [Marinobacter sp. BGYM27]
MMKRTLFSLAIAAATFALTACNDSSDDAPGGGSTLPATEAHRSVGIELSVLSSYRTGLVAGGDSAAEIVSYDPVNHRLFVINAANVSVDVLDMKDPAALSKMSTIDASIEGGSANSVAVQGNLVAVAIEANVKQANGKVVFYNLTDLQKVGEVEVGALPDMVVFTPDGNKVLVANEGEPNSDYTVDPQGSVSVIDLSAGVAGATVKTADFTAYNGQETQLRANGIRIFGPGASAAEDFEPEYIAVAPDGSQAWVTLQENNAVAVLDLATDTITQVLPLGYKDHMLAGNELDPSDRDLNASDKDGAIHIANWPVLGMYQPDSIYSYSVAGKTYYVTANEGDSRDYDGFTEEFRVKHLTLKAGSFAALPDLQEDHELGRLRVTATLGVSNGCDPSSVTTDIEADCEYDTLYAYGARSFSIWSDDGAQVFDSGSDFERITAEKIPDNFNSTNDENDSFDSRSDDKGPEPEGLVLGQIEDQTFAFIGLERVGGIMVYDITDPVSPVFVQYINNRDFGASETDLLSDMAGDLGPEGLYFIAADKSPTGEPLLAVGNEVSGSTTLYRIAVTELAGEADTATE